MTGNRINSTNAIRCNKIYGKRCFKTPHQLVVSVAIIVKINFQTIKIIFQFKILILLKTLWNKEWFLKQLDKIKFTFKMNTLLSNVKTIIGYYALTKLL